MAINGKDPVTPVVILWYSSGSWLGRLIRTVTKSPFTHNAILVDDVLYEALGRGIVRRTGTDATRRANEAVCSMQIYASAAQRSRVRAFLERHVGNGYSIAGFIAAGLDALFGWRFVIALDGEYICSGYVAAATVRLGLEPPQDARLMSPVDLYEWLVEPYSRVPAMNVTKGVRR